ncbi:concanavalin A-like lectin/glucanase domain-containing protein [Apiospora hydei]|uniref:Concanavalin A-like lectin/glucanase domain-containing protein n=1 Tax=Apiospora hydei TaxID=1337664 RepID=A0ABR1WZD4_9PEZI
MRGLPLFASALPLAGIATAYPRVDGPGAAGVQFSSRAAGKTVIPKDSFGAFDTHWSHNYPWGTDHNGGARMNPSKVSTSNNILTLTASPASGEPPPPTAGSTGGGYDLEADFKAPVAKGTWPAFWLTAVKGWPPEIDVAEWKGTGKISFNTFNTSSQVAAHDVTYPSPENWHTIRAQIRTASATDVWVKFFMDGGEITTQYGKNYVNSAFYLIIDLQMEGSSGSPGPSAGTTFQIRNVQVTDYNP